MRIIKAIEKITNMMVYILILFKLNDCEIMFNYYFMFINEGQGKNLIFYMLITHILLQKKWININSNKGNYKLYTEI